MANKESVAANAKAAENATADKEMEDKMVVVGGKVAANAANAARDVEDKKAANAANAAEDTRDWIDCRRTYLVL